MHQQFNSIVTLLGFCIKSNNKTASAALGCRRRVTNWTLSDRQLRCTILVGIAYGSDHRKAVAIVERSAIEHSQVIKHPAPEVYFEEFGDNALNLRLDFWVDLDIQPNRRRIMSDIRHRIEELFTENGIAIPFPQRDVHLDMAQPLRVEFNTAPTGVFSASGIAGKND
jgi:small-conductance mechanosensitive channel